MVKITVLGAGYVGLVSGACLADFGNLVTCVDPDPQRIEKLSSGILPIYEPGLEEVIRKNRAASRLSFTLNAGEAIRGAQVVFIAVGTPSLPDGSVDMSAVRAAATTVGEHIERYTVIVNKSTVPVGTCAAEEGWIRGALAARAASVEFDVVSNPEFLREGAAVQDFTHPDRIIIGSTSARATQVMKAVYRSLYLNDKPFIETDPVSAELIKYASNAFLALKITYINEIANLCEKVGANVLDVAKGMGRDPRIGSKFMHPGPGFGGSCLPKDTRALAFAARTAGSPLTLVEQSIAANEKQKLLMVSKMQSAMGTLRGRKIGVLGLSFKPNTDDVREAPCLAILPALVSLGAELRVFDPAAMDQARIALKAIEASTLYCGDEYEAVDGVDAVLVLTEWNQFRNLDLQRILGLLRSPFFFDARNIYPRDDMTLAGFRYEGVGH